MILRLMRAIVVDYDVLLMTMSASVNQMQPDAWVQILEECVISPTGMSFFFFGNLE